MLGACSHHKYNAYKKMFLNAFIVYTIYRLKVIQFKLITKQALISLVLASNKHNYKLQMRSNKYRHLCFIIRVHIN